MPKILISDKLGDKGLQVLKAAKGIEVDYQPGLSNEEIKKILPKYDGLIVRSRTAVTADLLKDSRLKVIGRAGIGVDNIDVEAATQRGIVVLNTPSGNVVTTAEHALAMIFAVSRQIPQATASLRAGRWEKGRFMGSELCNKTLGIVGLGNIGRVVADRALGLKMKVIGFDPFVSREAAEKIGVELAELPELYRRADYVTVHTPLNEKTRGMIDKKAFRLMKKGVYIINCARGGIVNEKDLLDAIDQEIVAGAALDVFEVEPPAPDHPLLKSEKVIFTPHLGAATDEAQENISVEVAELLIAYFTEGVIRNAVNFPSISGEMLKILGPYLGLLEKLGILQGQLLDELPKEVLVEYSGEITQYNLTALTQALLKGLLSQIVSDVSVNFVNASYVAKERGLKVVESKLSEPKDYASLVRVRVQNDHQQRSISGTIFGRTNPRIVMIDEFYLEAVPEGTILFIHNHDRPGVIGNIGTLLGKRSINISRMQLGLEKGKSEAIALYNVEGNVTPDLLQELKKLPNIISVRKIVL